MKSVLTSYLTSINNMILAKGGREVFSMEKAIFEYPILREPFDTSKLFYKKTVDVEKDLLNKIIGRSQNYLLGQQKEEGYWIGELEANTTITSEYIMIMHLMGLVDENDQSKMVNHLIRTQKEDGGWSIYYGGPTEISATVESYFAMRLARISADEPFMVKAKEAILKKGGVSASRIFTKTFLALFGLYDWRGIPAMPAEMMLLPMTAYINIYELSSWSRSVIVPLFIIFDKKPVYHTHLTNIDELFIEDKDNIDYSMEMKKFELSWRNLFLATDSLLKFMGKSPIKPFRNIALRKAEDWILEHQDDSGDWGGIIPAMMNSLLALKCLGYKNDHPCIVKGLEAMKRFSIEENNEIRLQSCISPVWDTAITCNALRKSGVAEDHPAIAKAGEWLIKKQIISRKGDWRVKNPDAVPGGWAFEFDNEFYPDNDDVAEVLLALNKVKIPEDKKRKKACSRGLDWLLSMQSSNGGWGAFDMDNDKEVLNRIPFADLESLLDPPTSDVTGRILWLLGDLGYDLSFAPAKKAYGFLRWTQEKDGTWFGRWGVNYVYGTFLVLCGLNSIGEHMEQQYIRKAVDWIKRAQNHDGGWGETCKSYEDESLKGVGVSTASQTAWALLGLMAAGEVTSTSVKRGVNYLIEKQNSDGTWDENEFTGTGFPKYFFIKYHMYRNNFPLLALSEYKNNTIN